MKEPGRLSVFQGVFGRAMGLAATPDRRYLATRYQLWQLEDVLLSGETEGPYDRIDKPHRAWTSGDVDVHDIVVAPDGKPVFRQQLRLLPGPGGRRPPLPASVAPPFITRLAPEDRCPKAVGLQAKEILGVVTHEVDGRVVRPLRISAHGNLLEFRRRRKP